MDFSVSSWHLALRDASFTFFPTHVITANYLFLHITTKFNSSTIAMHLSFPIAFEDLRPEVRYAIQLREQYYNSPALFVSLQGMWIIVSQSVSNIRRYEISYVCVDLN